MCHDHKKAEDLLEQILLASSNPNKARELTEILGINVELIRLELAEPQATNVSEVIEIKARDAFQLTGKAVYVEDTGLHFNAWNGLPGALVAWFVKTVGTSGICRMLEDWEDRSAYAHTMLGCYDGNQFRSYSGTMHGTIAFAPAGANGFGWDAIFIPRGYDLTLAEMEPQQKHIVSARREAAEQLKQSLISRCQ